MARGNPAEHSDTGGVDRGSSEDDGCPQVPRQLWLQFICESAQAPSREWTPVRAPPGYLTLQVPGAPLAHEFSRAASNLGTAIVVPLPASTQQPPAEAPIHRPDPEIEAAVINMECHERASRDNNNNPQ